MPLLIFLGIFIFDFSRAIYANNIIVSLSREGANFASRTINSPQDIINSLVYAASPLNMSEKGMIYITQLNGLSGGTVEIAAQHRLDRSGVAPPSRVGTCTPWAGGDCTPPNPNNRPLANLVALHLNPGDLAPGQTAWAVEVFYDYQVVFTNIINYRPVLYSISTF